MKLATGGAKKHPVRKVFMGVILDPEETNANANQDAPHSHKIP
jgi:hypothetical protein